jgi:cell division protein FtsL
MPLKAFVKKIEDVPEALRGEYKPVDKDKPDEGWVLDVDEKPYKAQLDEFRSNNRKLFSEKEQLVAVADKYKDMDPEKYHKAMEALANLEKLEDSELIKSGKFEDVIKKRTGQMEQTYKQQLAAKEKSEADARKKAEELESEYGNLLIETQFTQLFTGVATPKQGALTHLLLQARRDWGVKDKKLQARDIFNEKGDPITPEEYAKKVVSDAPFLFEASQGGGATGGRPQMKGAKPTISRNDTVGIGRNAAAIAKGEMMVVD